MPVTKEQYVQHLKQQGLDPSAFDIDKLVAEDNAQESSELTPVQAQPSISSTEAFIKSGKRSLIPSLAGISAASYAAAPFTEGGSLLIPLVIAGLTGAGVSAGTSAVQEKVIKGVQGEGEYNKSLVELEKAREQHPIASGIGEFAPGLLTAKPSLSNIKSIGRSLTAGSLAPEAAMALKSAAVQAGVGGAIEVGSELAQGQDLSVGRIGAQAAAGGLLTKPWGLGKTKLFGGGSTHPDQDQPTQDTIKEPLPKSRQLGFPENEQASSAEHPLVTPWEGSTLKRQQDFQKARVEEGLQQAGDLQSKLTGNQIQAPAETPKVNPQKTSMKGIEASNMEIAKSPISESEQIQEDYDKGIRHQKESQLAADIKEYLLKSGRAETSNEDVVKKSEELAFNQGVKRIVYDPGYLQNSGEFNPTTGVIKVGPKVGLDTIFHEGVHALNKNILEGKTTPAQLKILSDTIETLSKQGAVDPEEVLTEAAGKHGVKGLLDRLDNNRFSQLQSWVKDVTTATKGRFGVDVKSEDVSRLLARWHIENAGVASPVDPVAFVAGRIIKEQKDSELGLGKEAKMPRGIPPYVGHSIETAKDISPGKENITRKYFNPETRTERFNDDKLVSKIVDESFNNPADKDRYYKLLKDASKRVLDDLEETELSNYENKLEDSYKKIQQVGSQLSKQPYPAAGERVPEVARQQENSELQPAKVVYKGYQEGYTNRKGEETPGTHLYNTLEEHGPNLPKGATVSEDTLKQHGFAVPEDIKPTAKTQSESELTSAKQPFFTRLALKVAPTHDRIALETKGTKLAEEGAYAAKTLNKFEGVKGSLEGKFDNGVREILGRYSPEEQQRVLNKQDVQDITDGQKILDLSYNESKLDDELRKYLVDVHEVQRAKGLTIHGRAAKDNPNYVPSILSREALDTLTNHGVTEEAAKLKKLWTDYRVEQSKKTGAAETPEIAAKVIDDYIRAINAKSETALEFNAIRKAEGLGLPVELRDPNAISRYSRYGQRVAKDFAWHETVQSDPIARKVLFQRDQHGQLPDSTEEVKLPSGKVAEDLYSQKYVRDAIDLAKGKFGQVPDSIMKVSKVVTSSLLGTGTGIRNTVQLFSQGLPYVEARDLPSVVRAISEATSNFNEASRKAFLAGSYKNRINDIQFADNPDRIVTALDKTANFFRKWQGADLIERMSRVYTHTLGDILTTSQFQRASNNKDVKALEFLHKFGHTVEGGIDKYLGRNVKDIPSEVVQRVAKEFVDVVQGSYDGRELPLAALNSPYAPFLTLSRWSIGRMNHVYKDVVQPLRAGNPLPFLKYTLGTILTGAAIQQLNGFLSGKKDINPTVQESLAAGNNEELAYSVISLMQLGSFAGIVGDLIKGAVDVRHGQLPKGPFSFPLGDFVSNTTQDIANASAAIDQGAKASEVGLSLVEKLLRNSIQSYRYIANNTFKSEDVKRGQEFRDLDVFKRLSGQPATPVGDKPNEFINADEKKFKKETDLSKAFGEELPQLIKDAIEESHGDYELLKRKLAGLKSNNYQTFPSPSEQPMTAKKYMDFLDATVGPQERQRKLNEYFKQNIINKVKSSAVPSF